MASAMQPPTSLFHTLVTPSIIVSLPATVGLSAGVLACAVDLASTVSTD